jgi:hypothetical protein
MVFKTVALLPLLANVWTATAASPVVFEPSGHWYVDQ